MLEAMGDIRNADQATEIRTLPLSRLRSGMILAQDVFTKTGLLFLAKGQEITPGLLDRFKNFAPGLLAGADSLRVIVENHCAPAE
jgi:hypothetical protein